MKLEILEDEKNKLKIAVEGESHTLLNILRENSWKSGADQASYTINHPYNAPYELIVHSESPRKTLNSALQMIVDQAKEFNKEFAAAAKK